MIDILILFLLVGLCFLAGYGVDLIKGRPEEFPTEEYMEETTKE
jgi:hypothetical protein